MLGVLSRSLVSVMVASYVLVAGAASAEILMYNYSYTFTDNVGQNTISGVLSIDKNSGVPVSGGSEWTVTNATSHISGSFGAINFSTGTYDQYSSNSSETFNFGFLDVNMGAVYVSIAFNAIFLDPSVYNPLGYLSFSPNPDSAVLAPNDSNVYTAYAITAASVSAISAVPEPAALLLLTPALAILVGVRFARPRAMRFAA